MDYDDNDSQGHNLAGEGNSKSSPVLRPFALPKYDFDDSLQGHLRFESLVENEVFLGISSQEDSQWIEDFSRGNSGIEFSSSATEPCSISRRNNVWSEATSSESVAMLLKSVGQEERIQGETIIEESDAGNELGMTTEMEPNLKQGYKLEDVTNSQPTALPDSFVDGRNVNALESEKDNPPVWSEATSSESVAMLLKSVGQEERIQGETIIEESDAGNELGMTTEMEPNLKQDDKLEDVTTSEPTALPDSFLDGRNVNALESEKDNPPVNGSSSDVSNVSSVIVSEADVGSDKKCDDTNQLEVNNLDKPQVDNLEGLSPEIHVRNVTSMSPSDIASSSELNGKENEHRVTDACFETVDGLLRDIPQRMMAEKNICGTESTMVNLISSGTGSATCTRDVEDPQFVVSNLESLEQNKDETNITSIDDPSKLQEKVTCDLQIVEASKIDKGSVVPSQHGNVEVEGCNEGEKFCKPLQDSLCDSSVACLNEYTFEVVNKNAGNSACTEVEISIVEEKENSCSNQINRLESQNAEVVDTKTGNSSCPEHDMDSILEKDEEFENHMGGGAVDEASLLPDVEHRLSEQGEGSGVKHVGNPDLSLSCTVSGSPCEKQLSTEDLSDIKTHIVLEDNNSPQAHTSSLVLGGHMQLSKNNLSFEQEDAHGFEKDVSSHEGEDAKLPTASLCPDEFSKANLVHGSEFLKSASNGRGSKVAEEMHLSSCDTPNGLPFLSGANTTGDGVTLCEQGQKSQVTNLLGVKNLSQVTTDLEPVSLPESGQASRIEKAAGLGCSTKEEACPVLIGSEIKLVDATAPAACNEEILMERNAEVALQVVGEAVLLSSQSVVPAESVSVSVVEPSTMIQKDHEVKVTSGTRSTENPSTKVDSPEKSQASVALASPSKCTADSVNKDGDASADSFEENARPPSVISFAKTPLSDDEQQTRTKEVSIGSVQHSKATHGAGGTVQSVSLHMQHDSSNNGESSTVEVSLSTGVSEGETIKGLQSYPVQVHKPTDVKEYPSEGNPGPPSVIGCAKIPLGETGQKSRAKEASVGTVQHSEATPDAGGKAQSAALHMQHDDFIEDKIIRFEVSSSTGLSESEIIKGSPSYPSIPVHKKSTDVKGYPLASDCSRIDLTKVPEHSHENSEGTGPMSGKKRAGAKGTSERKTKQGSVKTSARANAKKRGVQETPVNQFERDESMTFLSSPGTSHLVQFQELKPSSNAERSGALPTPMSNIPDLNTSVTPAAYLQQPFTDLQQVQLRAQILVHGSLMQNSVPDQACMISAFGPSDGGGSLWEPAWRACSERIHTQKSNASNLETPARSRSGSKGPDQPVKNSSLQSETPLPAGRASSKGIPSPVVNPIIPLSSPLWNVSTPSCDGFQSSGTIVDYHQPFASLQPYQAQGTRGFVGQSPSWLFQTHFPGQWVASPQTSALDVNARVSSIFCTEPVKLAPAEVSSVPNHPAIKQATHLSVSSAGVSFGTSSQTDVNKVSILSGQNSVNPKHKKRKKVSVSKSPGQIPLLTLDQAASVSDASNHLSEKATAPRAVLQNSLFAQSLPEIGSPVVNNVSSMSNAATTSFFASTSQSGNYLAAVSLKKLSDQPTRVDQIVDKKSIVSEETLNEVEAAKLQAEAAAAHAAAAVSNCNDVWSQLSKLKNSGLSFDDETKLSSAAMAIAAAASVAKAAAAAAKLASNVAIGAKLMADEVSTTSVTKNNTHSTGISLLRSSHSSPMTGEGNVSASSIIAAAKETVKKRVEAATAASKHAENLDAMVKAAELAAEAVSQAGKIVSIGDPLPLSELVDSGPMDYWRTPQVSPEQGANARSDQRETFNPEKLALAEPPKDGAIIMGEAANPGTVTSIGRNSSTTQRGHRAFDPAPDSYCETNSEAVTSRDAHKTAPGTSFENGMVEGCLVEVFKDGDKFKAAWYSAKILKLNDGKAFVCYTELQADDGKLKEWVPLKGDGLKAPTIRIPHPTSSMCFDRTRKRRRAAVMDYTWCVGDRVDAWVQDCWLEGVVKEKNKNDETTLTIYIPAIGGTSAIKTWHLRPTVTWQDGKWIEWPTAIRQSPTQGDTPQEKRVKLGNPAIEAAKENKISGSIDLVESKEHEESRPLPLLANEKEFNIGNNTRDNKVDAPRVARTGLQKEGSRVVFGVPKPGKKRKFMDVSKHLDSDRCSKSTKASDSIKTARYLPQAPGGRSWNNNTNVDINEKQAVGDKPKVLRSGKPQSVSGRVLPQKINLSVSAKSRGKIVSKEENNSAQQDLMEFGSVSDSQDTSEGPTLVSSKGLPRVSRKRVPSSNTKSVHPNKGRLAAAGGEFGKKVEQDKSFPQVAEPRRSNRKIQPTSRLLEGLQSSLIGSKMPSVPHEKIQRNLN